MAIKFLSKVKSISKTLSKSKVKSASKAKVFSKSVSKKVTSKVKVVKKKFNVKAIKRVNNNLIFTYAKNAIKFGIPITAYFYIVLRTLNPIYRIENNARINQRYNDDIIRENNFGGQQQRAVANRENVHDRQVNQQSIDIYNRYPIPRQETVENSINEMRRVFRNDRIVTNVINNIVRRNQGDGGRPIMALHRTELQCLTTVFTNVVDNEDKLNYFAQMLRDCVGNYEGLVCQTGVVNRIVVALLIDNPDAIPRNFRLEFANELQNLAIRVRNQVLANNNLQTDEQRTTEFQNILRRQAYADYAENRNITIATLDEILEPLLEACC
jgi:hypothetical protein